jgi:iron complex transport system substrate-binding protein
MPCIKRQSFEANQRSAQALPFGGSCLSLGCAAAVLLLSPVLIAACRSEQSRSPPRGAGPPSRIIAFAPSSTEVIASLGALDRLVAVGSFCTYPPEIARLPKVGGLFDPDLEGILRLRPDLIVLRGLNREVQQLCEANHIRLYQDPTENLAGLYQAIRNLGDLLDRRAAARSLEGDLKNRLAHIAAAVSGRRRPRVFFVVSRRDPDSLAGILTASAATFVDELIASAGGENVFHDLAVAYPEVSPEAILAAQPEIIVDAMPEARPSAELAARIRKVWRRLGPVPAVQNDRVYALTEDHALIPSPRVVQTVAKLARLFHPEVRID